MNKQTFIPALCAVLAPALPLHADESVDRHFDEIVVTATRTPVSVGDSLSSVTVISREDLDTLQAVDLVDVFRQVPGTDISSNGGPGSAASLFMRGAASDQTLILVDGQRISSATLGGASFHLLEPSQIERIEVVRGAGSSLYGSEAIGGVIQIFTKDGGGKPKAHVSTAGGSNNLRQASAGSEGSLGNFRYGINLSYLETDGFDNLVNDEGHNGDRDGYRNDSASVNLGYRFDSGADLSLRFLQNNSRNEYDSVTNPAEKPYTDTWIQNVSAKLTLPLTKMWLSQLSVGRAVDDSDTYDEIADARINHFRTERDQLLWQNDFSIGDNHTLTLGYDYYEDQVEASSAFEDSSGRPVDTRSNRAAFVQHQATVGPVRLVLGLREDDDEEFGSHATGNVALGFKPDANHQWHVSWSEGFKAPTFNDLYWPASPWSAGNPELAPETSEHYEAGVRGDYGVWYWSANYFESDIDNLINWAAGSDGVWRPYNVNAAEITGSELVAGAMLAGWQMEASISYVDPQDADTGDVLANRARQTGVFRINKELNRWTLGLNLKAQSERYLNDGATLSGYATVGARVAYRYNARLSAQLKVDNLFDRDYQLNEGYNQDGANWLFSLAYSL